MLVTKQTMNRLSCTFCLHQTEAEPSEHHPSTGILERIPINLALHMVQNISNSGLVSPSKNVSVAPSICYILSFFRL